MVRVTTFKRQRPWKKGAVESISTRLFRKGVRYEGILTTYNGVRINSSAVRYEIESDIVRIRLFKGSDSYSNMMMQDLFTIGVIDMQGLKLIARAALYGHESFIDEFHIDDYAASSINGDVFYLLEDAPASLHCRVVDQSKGSKEDEWGENEYVDLEGAIIGATPQDIKPIYPITLYPSRVLETLIILTRSFDIEDESRRQELLEKAAGRFDRIEKVGSGEVLDVMKDFIRKETQG